MTSEDLSAWTDATGAHVRRRVRLLMLLDAADYAVIAPINTSRLHAFAYLADVLSPIYELTSLTGVVLKRRIGPYFPELQWELDRLVGYGMVEVTELRPVVEKSSAYIDASYTLNRVAAFKVLEAVQDDIEFVKLREFMRELGSMLGRVPDDDLDATMQADVTWDTGHAGTIIDYAEWKARNFSDLSAERLGELASAQFGKDGVDLSPGAKVSLYVQYLRRAANA